ncbi:hypothetical protein CC2G_005020 [Coprinopsis cinerea AmutBmut pab1-1]|nr:hypothetical protein CC2G_005020 [Coprinopsis cinerea AmutBmut pab1-1]
MGIDATYSESGAYRLASRLCNLVFSIVPCFPRLDLMATTRAKGKSSTPSPSKKRAARHCRKCPGSPLLASCPCRRRGRRSAPSTSSQASGVNVPNPQGGPLGVASGNNALPPLDLAFVPIDPALLAEDAQRAQQPQPLQPSSSPPPLSPSSASVTGSGRRIRPSNQNPIYGFVDGAGRGNACLRVARVRKLEPPFALQTDATRKFDEWTRDLLTRAESISTRTGSWVYIAVHNPNSRTPFTWFTSRKLRREAPGLVQEVHSVVSKTMKAVVAGVRESATQLEASRIDAETRADAATQHATQVSEENRRLKADLEARNRLLASLLSNNPGVITQFTVPGSSSA